MTTRTILSPIKLGALQLRNRVVMAPLTRCRATNTELAPNEMMATHYAQRATAGLIISEGAVISPQARGYPFTPGIWSEAQVTGWRKVTDAVHSAGGMIVCQLWHCGRMSLPELLDGELPVAPSAVNPHWTMFTPSGPRETATPQELSVEGIASIVSDFRQAASNAMAAGFDGVEIHSSNGYLIHQFFAGCSNVRTDEYGGSHSNRARILFEILDAVTEEVPSDRIGIRLNPMMNKLHGILVDDDTLPTFEFIVDRVNDYSLAYVHLTEPFLPGQLDGTAHAISEIAPHFRGRCRSPIISNGGFDPSKAENWIQKDHCDAVAFGRPFIANPDLVDRIRLGASLNQPDPDTFYQGGEHGYLDYPLLTN